MKAEISSKIMLPTIASASGLELINNRLYIIGDDTKYLFVLDTDFNGIDQLELFESDKNGADRIAKKYKPDLESIAHIKINELDYLLILGSGSKENRDHGFLVCISETDNSKTDVQKVDFKLLYDFLRADDKIVKNGKLNIEGAASDERFFILLNRANKKGNNAVLVFETGQILALLSKKSDTLPKPKVQVYDLPEINNVPSGFSGAYIFENKLFFTASAEDTSDAVEDGNVAGSLIGFMQILAEENPENRVSEIVASAIITESGNIFLGKLESIVIFKKHAHTHYSALAVTDNDLGGSELILIEIHL